MGIFNSPGDMTKQRGFLDNEKGFLDSIGDLTKLKNKNKNKIIIIAQWTI